MASKTLEEIRRERRLLEDRSLMSPFERFTSGFGNMFDSTDPTAPMLGDVVGGMPSMPNTRTADMTMTGATIDDMGNIIPGANARGSVLGVPVPAYARPTPMQGITMNPAFVEGQAFTPAFLGQYNEFTSGGGADPVFGLFGQETESYRAFIDDLSDAGKEKFARINRELQAIPRSEMRRREEFVKDKKNLFRVDDFNKEGKEKFGVTQSLKDGKDINVLTGGILSNQGTVTPNLDTRIPSTDSSRLPGSTVQQTIDDSGMKLINDGQVAVPTRQSLQYTGDKVPFMSPAIRGDMEASGLGIAGYQNILDNYVNKEVAEAAPSFVDSLGGITGMVGLLGDIMVMQSLLDNKQQAPAAAAPRGLVGAKITEDDPYKRRF
tara:strand:- start:5137 stop:6270 length:1134 start_codon:yes stop_codon:yes gene_type:complete